MDEDRRQTAADRRLLDDELVPLSVASQVAYFHITKVEVQPREHSALTEALPLVAVALASIAPIEMRSAAGAARRMNAEEVEESLARPIREGKHRPDLDGFFIRRGDLRIAMKALAEARK